MAAVIREAIDVRFPPGQGARSAALTSFLGRTEALVDSTNQSWVEMKAEMEGQLDEDLIP